MADSVKVAPRHASNPSQRKWLKLGERFLAYKNKWGDFRCESLSREHAINLRTSIKSALYVWASLGRCARAFLKCSEQLTSLGVNKIESSANAPIWLFCGGTDNGA